MESGSEKVLVLRSVSVFKSGVSLVLDAKGIQSVQCGISTVKLLMKSEFLKDEVCRLVSFQIQHYLIYLPFLFRSCSG